MFYDKINAITSKINPNIYILGNKINGRYIKIPNECLLALECSYENKLSVENSINLFKKDSDKKYFLEYLKKVDEINLLSDNLLTDNSLENIQKITFSIIENCNLNCRYCSSYWNKNKDSISSYDKVKNIIDKIISLNPKSINISGGEPFIRRDLIEILEYLRNRFSGTIVLSTNATLIEEEIIPKLILFIDGIFISLDGYSNDTVRIERGEKTFTKVLQIVDTLKKHNFNNISLSMVESKKTAGYEDSFKKLCDENRVKPIVRTYYKLNSEYADDYLDNIKDIFYYTDSYNKENLMYSCNSCGAGTRELFINSKGDIYLCPLICENEFLIGNILTDEKHIILNQLNEENGALKRFFKKTTLYRTECLECKWKLFCFKCPAIFTNITNEEFRFNCNKMKSIFENK